MFHWAYDLTGNSVIQSISLTTVKKTPFVLRMTPTIRRKHSWTAEQFPLRVLQK